MKLYWLDLETTGLDTREDKILEISVSRADLHSPFDVEFVKQAVFNFDGTIPLNPFVQKMHTDNGLLEECKLSNKTVGEVEKELLEVVQKVENRDDMPVLAGSSVHFDHGFLKTHMPELAKRFSHRCYDVSAISLFCQSIGMPPPPKVTAHRASSDVQMSIGIAESCKEWLASRGFR